MKNRTKLLSLLFAMSLAATGCGHTGAPDKEPVDSGINESVDSEAERPVDNEMKEPVDNETEEPVDQEVNEAPLDSKVSKVTWSDCTNDSSKTFYGDDATIEFTFTDGTTQEVVIGAYSTVDSMNKNDMDNDGEEEYVFHITYVNTIGENEFLYVYKIDDNKAELWFPGNTGITEVDENACLEEETTVEVDGKNKNAIKVECAVRDEGRAKATYDGIIYYDNGQWNEYNK